VGIAIRRFAERLEKDRAVRRKVSLVQEALELRESGLFADQI
jgi:hypothetical protein